MLIPPNIFTPLSDEYVFSYFLRLADANGFEGRIKDFLNTFQISSVQIRNRRKVLQTEELLFGLLRAMEMDPREQIEILYENTLYGALAPLMKRERQSYIINAYMRAFSTGSILTGMFRMLESLAAELRVCPECAAEDMDSIGVWRLHTQHQMPGMTVCPKHGTPLQVISSSLTDLNIHEEPKAVKTCEATDDALQYAMFINGLRELNPDVCKQDMYQIFDISVLGRKKDIRDLMQFPPEDTVRELMHLYGMPENVPFYKARTDEVSEEEFRNELAQRGYALTSSYCRCKPLVIRHIACGLEHITTVDNFMKGWECPVCDMERPDIEIISSLVEHAGNGQYHLLDKNVDAISNPLSLYHDACGETTHVHLSQFLNGKESCICEHMVTHESFAARVNAINPDVELISTYVNATVPLQCRCRKCGKEWSALPVSLLNGSGCPFFREHEDYVEPRLLPHEEFVNRMAKDRPDVEVIGQYAGGKKPIKLRCKVCGEEYTVLAAQATQKLCPNIKNHEGYLPPQINDPNKFKDMLEQERPDLEVIGEYAGFKKPISLKCRVCGEEFTTTAGNAKTKLCPNIKNHDDYRDPRAYTTEEFREKLAETRPDLELIGEYEGINKPITVRCRICGEVFSTLAATVKDKNCPNKKNHDGYRDPRAYTTEEFREKLAETRPDLELIGEYKNKKEPILVRCKLCGEVFTAVPMRIKKKVCPNRKNHSTKG